MVRNKTWEVMVVVVVVVVPISPSGARPSLKALREASGESREATRLMMQEAARTCGKEERKRGREEEGKRKVRGRRENNNNNNNGQRTMTMTHHQIRTLHIHHGP
jgi:Sec-independent protein translocase protein TatA